MAFPSTVTDIVATAIESRSKVVADNITKNNPLYARLKKRGNIKEVSGGSQIFQELSYAENPNGAWYSGADQLSTGAADVISASTFSFKQLACPVVINGLEKLQNAGKEQMLDLLEERLGVAEGTMDNLMEAGAFSDGTGFGGKQIVGLNLAVSSTPTSGVYGGIDPSVWSFWQNQLQAAGAQSAGTIQQSMNTLWSKMVRGNDRPDLIIFDNNLWAIYMQSLQAIQRFTSAEVGDLGFPSIKFMDADVILGGGIGGFCPQNAGYFLNTKYLFLRPHKDRNMTTLDGERRPINQDIDVSILAWAGAMTCSGRKFQGYFQGY